MAYAQITPLQTDEVLGRDRLNAIINAVGLSIAIPNGYYAKPTTDGNLTVTSTSYVAVDDTSGKFFLPVTTYGNPVEISFRGLVTVTTASHLVYFDVEIDGNLLVGAANNGLTLFQGATSALVSVVQFKEVVFGLAAGTHNFKLRWKVNTGTGTLYSNSRPSFFVREL